MLQKSTQFQTRNFSKKKLFTPKPYKILQKHLTEVAATPVVAWAKNVLKAEGKMVGAAQELWENS